MEFKRVSKNAAFNMLLNKFFVFAFFVSMFIIGIEFADGEKYDLTICIFGIPVLLLSAIDTFVFSFIQQKRIKYYIDDDKIIIKKGVIFRKDITIPMLQIQDIGSFQGPLMMLFKIKKVMISTAGSNREIYGLNFKTADEIVESLRGRIQEKLKRDISNEEI